jgi:hypothetical protein
MRARAILLPILLLSACDSSASADQGTNHTVRQGESLFSIAERAYGNGLEWPRIWEANPWLDPDNLRAGEIVRIPARDPAWGDPPPREDYLGDAPLADREAAPAAAPEPPRGSRRTANPGSGTPGLGVFKNLANHVSEKTLFGLRPERVLVFVFLACLLHAVFQGVLVWLTANITFVKEASFKKSMKATFLTEMLTFATVISLAGIAIIMLYLGSEPAGAGAGASPLFPSLEAELRRPAGLAIAGLIVLALYVVLSLRFIPQVFGLPMGRAIALMAFAVLIPHLVGFYFIGQRTGIIR